MCGRILKVEINIMRGDDWQSGIEECLTVPRTNSYFHLLARRSMPMLRAGGGCSHSFVLYTWHVLSNFPKLVGLNIFISLRVTVPPVN